MIPGTFCGLSVKNASLLILAFQNSALFLIARYSQTQEGPRCLSLNAVIVGEIIKCVACFVLHLRQKYYLYGEPRAKLSVDGLISELRSVRVGLLQLFLPATLYTIQNSLHYVAAANLEAITFQVTSQIKILTTAFFATVILHRSLSLVKWIGLVLLATGIALVQVPSSVTAHGVQSNNQIGFFAVAVACFCSGFAGIYLEQIFKSSTNGVTVWMRNVQLSACSLMVASLSSLMWHQAFIADNGFFTGFGPLTIVTICTQAAGGLIVAMVIKYADSISKGFATSISIVLSSVISVFVLDFIVTGYFLAGTVLVIAATFLYHLPQKATMCEGQQMGLGRSRRIPTILIQDYDKLPGDGRPSHAIKAGYITGGETDLYRAALDIV